MHHDSLSSETISSFAAASGGATVPRKLMGTRAALFHLLKEAPRRDTGPARIFGGNGAGGGRQEPTGDAPVSLPGSSVAAQDHAPAPGSHAQRLWRDMLLEDNFDFVKFGT